MLIYKYELLHYMYIYILTYITYIRYNSVYIYVYVHVSIHTYIRMLEEDNKSLN